MQYIDRRVATAALSLVLPLGVLTDAIPATAVTGVSPVTADSETGPRDAKRIAKKMVARRDWSGRQHRCLVQLWQRESGWRVHAGSQNGSYGIPQAYPGTKMASAGKRWRDDATTQIRWGLEYIEDRYGTPCAAWSHFQRVFSY